VQRGRMREKKSRPTRGNATRRSSRGSMLNELTRCNQFAREDNRCINASATRTQEKEESMRTASDVMYSAARATSSSAAR